MQVGHNVEDDAGYADTYICDLSWAGIAGKKIVAGRYMFVCDERKYARVEAFHKLHGELDVSNLCIH